MKKTRKNSRRLQLRKEALRQLDKSSMDQVNGGTVLRDSGYVIANTLDCGGCWYSFTSHTGGAELEGSAICL